MWGKALGLDAIVVRGYTKTIDDIGTYSTEEIQAWNIIKIDGVQYLVDSTWGAGYCEGDKYTADLENDYYFGINPEYFIRTHF